MKVDYDLYYKDSGSVNKGHYVESNESVSISLSHDYTTVRSEEKRLYSPAKIQWNSHLIQYSICVQLPKAVGMK